MRKVFIILLMLCLPVTSVAADDYKDKVDQIMILSGQKQTVGPMMGKMIDQLAPMMKANIKTDLARKNAVIDSEKLDEFIVVWKDIFIAEFEKEMLDLIAPVYKKFYTEQELDDLIELMKNPVFKRYAAKVPALSEAAQNAGALLGQRLGASTAQKAMKQVGLE